MKITVRVPATTANLGPGFDCLGLALQLWNTIVVEEWRGGPEVRLRGSPQTLPADSSNLALLAMSELFKLTRGRPRKFQVKLTNRIPVGRGLGSSAAAIVGGLVAANAWSGSTLLEDRLLELAVELEGHPDNVAPALRGGLVIVIREGEKVVTAQVRPARAWRAVLFIPETALSTKSAREVLPAHISREDAIYNIGRAALLVRAFAMGDADGLDLATGDRLHEPYRAHLVPGMGEFCDAASRAGAHGVALSGAGPSMVAFASGQESAQRIARAFERTARALKIQGSARVLGLAARGAQVHWNVR